MLTFSNEFDCLNQTKQGFRKLKPDTYYIQNKTYNIIPNNIIYVDTSNGQFSLYLNNVVITSGDVIVIIDIGNNLYKEPIRLLNLKKVNNEFIEEFILSKPSSIYKFYYVSEEFGWTVESNLLLGDNINQEINLVNYYTTTQIDNIINNITIGNGTSTYWNLIINKPTTLLEYAITDVYTITEVDNLISNINITPTIDITNVLNEFDIKLNTDIDNKLNEFNILWNNIISKPISIIDYGIIDVYTKSEIINNYSNVTHSHIVNWNDIINKPVLYNDIYTKTEIDTLLIDVVNNNSDLVYWSTVINKPTTISGFGITDSYTRDESDLRYSERSHNHIINWVNITNKPHTVSEYGIIDTYTKNESDILYSNINHNHVVSWNDIVNKPIVIGITDTYTKLQIDTLISNLVTNNGKLIYWNTILNKPTTIIEFGITDTFTKEEIINQYSSKNHTHVVSWNSVVSKPNTISGLGIIDSYTKNEIETFYAPINHIHSIRWSEITNRPATLSGYGINDAYTRNDIITLYSDKNHTHIIEWGDIIGKPVIYNTDSYTKSEIDLLLNNLITDELVYWNTVLNKPTTISGYGITDSYTKNEIDVLLNNLVNENGELVYWATILNKPTTISGYGIIDSYTKNEIINLYATKDHTHTWLNISNKPVDIAGYGIIDAYTKSEIINLYATKTHTHTISWDTIVNKPITISGLGITDAYTKEQIASIYSQKTHSHIISWNDIQLKPILISEFGITDVYTKTECNSNYALRSHDHLINHYSKTESDSRYSLQSHNHVVNWNDIVLKPIDLISYGIVDVYTKTEIHNIILQLNISDTAFVTWNGIIDRPTTISGFNISDAYTKLETNNIITNIIRNYYSNVESDSKYAVLNHTHDFGLTYAGVNHTHNFDSIYATINHTHDSTYSLLNHTHVFTVNWDDIVNKPSIYTKSEVDVLVNSNLYWNVILNKPNTINGYGILDSYTKSEINELIGNIDGVDTVAWANIINKPTTIIGFNITDVYTKSEVDLRFANINTDPNHTHSEYFNVTTGGTITGEFNITNFNVIGGGLGTPGANLLLGNMRLYTFYGYDMYSQSNICQSDFRGNYGSDDYTFCRFRFAGDVTPSIDKVYSCGGPDFKWLNIYADTGVIQTSDERNKIVLDQSPGLEFISKLNPVQYKLKVSSNKIENMGSPESENTILTPIPGKRIHYGLVAQQVKHILDELNIDSFAGWIKTNIEDSESSEGLRYEEFIAPIIKSIQELNNDLQNLKSQLGV